MREIPVVARYGNAVGKGDAVDQILNGQRVFAGDAHGFTNADDRSGLSDRGIAEAGKVFAHDCEEFMVFASTVDSAGRQGSGVDAVYAYLPDGVDHENIFQRQHYRDEDFIRRIPDALLPERGDELPETDGACGMRVCGQLRVIDVFYMHFERSQRHAALLVADVIGTSRKDGQVSISRCIDDVRIIEKPDADFPEHFFQQQLQFPAVKNQSQTKKAVPTVCRQSQVALIGVDTAVLSYNPAFQLGKRPLMQMD